MYLSMQCSLISSLSQLKREILRKVLQEIYNTVYSCFITFEIKNVLEFKEVHFQHPF